jgi:hypothetical protein
MGKCALVYGSVVQEWTVRESTGNFGSGNRRYGNVREIFRTGMDGTGSPGIPVPYRTGNFPYRGNNSIRYFPLPQQRIDLLCDIHRKGNATKKCNNHQTSTEQHLRGCSGKANEKTNGIHPFVGAGGDVFVELVIQA